MIACYPKSQFLASLAALCLYAFAGLSPAHGQISDSGGRDRLMRPAPPGAEARGKQASEDWQRRLQSVDADLRRGDWPSAKDGSRRLVREMFERIIDGEGAAPTLAMAVLLRGLATAGVGGTGDREAGLWDWFVAQSLFPGFRQTDLTAYGEPGRLFAEYRLGAGGERPAAAQTTRRSEPDPTLERDVSAPSPAKKVEPVYPPALSRLCRRGKVVVETIIETSGEVSYPIVKEPGESPVLTFSTLEALREWRFEPARLRGEPVRVYYSLTVNYQTRGCVRR